MGMGEVFQSENLVYFRNQDCFLGMAWESVRKIWGSCPPDLLTLSQAITTSISIPFQKYKDYLIHFLSDMFLEGPLQALWIRKFQAKLADPIALLYQEKIGR